MVKNDPKKSDKHKTTASSVLKTIRGIKKTFEKDGSISSECSKCVYEGSYRGSFVVGMDG